MQNYAIISLCFLVFPLSPNRFSVLREQLAIKKIEFSFPVITDYIRWCEETLHRACDPHCPPSPELPYKASRVATLAPGVVEDELQGDDLQGAARGLYPGHNP